MTPFDRSPPPPDAFANCDAVYLRELRQAVDMDPMILARKACLSVGQVRALESGIDGRYFYSETIKRQAYKRVLQVLGVTPPHETPQTTAAVILVNEAQLDALDQIVSMSHRPSLNRPLFSFFHSAKDRLLKHQQAVSVAVLLLLALSGLGVYRTQNSAQRMSAEVEVTTAGPKEMTAQATCAFSSEAMPQFSPQQAHKEGRYVYLVSNAPSQICVVDGQKRASLLQMKAGESQSIYGAAPWQISGTNLRQVKIYFQGNLVTLPEGAPQQLSLIEASLTR